MEKSKCYAEYLDGRVESLLTAGKVTLRLYPAHIADPDGPRRPRNKGLAIAGKTYTPLTVGQIRTQPESGGEAYNIC